MVDIGLTQDPALDESSQGIFLASASTVDDIFHKVVVGDTVNL
jgi:hypothetical protein